MKLRSCGLRLAGRARASKTDGKRRLRFPIGHRLSSTSEKLGAAEGFPRPAKRVALGEGETKGGAILVSYVRNESVD